MAGSELPAITGPVPRTRCSKMSTPTSCVRHFQALFRRRQHNGTIVTGPWLDRPAPRRPSPVATKAKGAQPQQPVLALAGPPTVTLTHLKPDATGTLAPRASAARPERAQDRSKTTSCRDFQDSRLGSRLVTGRTSRIEPSTPMWTLSKCRSHDRSGWSDFIRSQQAGLAGGLEMA